MKPIKTYSVYHGISKISFDEGLQLFKKLYINSRSIFNKNR